jgi:hypothetical protein
MATRTKRSSWIAAGAFAAVLLAAASPAYAWGYGHVGFFRPHFGFRAYARPHVSFYVGAPYYGYSYPYPYYAYTGYAYPYPYEVYPYAHFRYARPYYRYPYRSYYPHRVLPRRAPFAHRY